MRLRLDRFERTSRSTIGKLYVDDVFACFTLEDPVRPYGIKIPGATAIPAGTYRVQITWSPRFKVRMPILIGVPNFSGVRIHPGNFAEDTDGCILVGNTRDGDMIGESRKAYQALFAVMQEALKEGEDIFIDIVNVYQEA